MALYPTGAAETSASLDDSSRDLQLGKCLVKIKISYLTKISLAIDEAIKYCRLLLDSTPPDGLSSFLAATLLEGLLGGTARVESQPVGNQLPLRLNCVCKSHVIDAGLSDTCTESAITTSFSRFDVLTIEMMPLGYTSHQLEQAIETLERRRTLSWSKLRCGFRTSIDKVSAADPPSGGPVAGVGH